MPFLAKILNQLNLKAQCNAMGVGLLACPHFIFLIMGIVTAISIAAAYMLVQRFTEPEVAAIIVLFLSAFLIVIAFSIVKAFEKVVEAKKREAEETQKLLQLKDQFLVVAAHELRVPATTIKWGLETLDSNGKKMTKSDLETFAMIQKSNERLLGLVSDILEASKTEGKRIKVELGNVSVREAVEDSIKEVKKVVNDKKVFIKNEITKDMPKCRADPIRLREILVNLLTNAVKYSSEGGEVMIFGEVRAGKCIVHIEDNGIGIKEEDFEKIFTKFWRAPEVKSMDGTGLGLFIVKELLSLMDGEIWFKSVYKQGSTFSFTLQAIA